MCGIVGAISNNNVLPKLINGIKKLEYRGYDSAGVALISNDTIQTERSVGKIKNLEKALEKKALEGNIGIAHTRWATHGKPTKQNAHPHYTEKAAIVHNGIIENHQEIKNDLIKKGYKFKSDTDSEVIAVLITSYLDSNEKPYSAFEKSIKQLHGSYAIACIFNDKKDFMIVSRKGSPLAVGFGENENFAGSDALALSELTNKITYLKDNDIAVIKKDEIQIFDENNNKVTREIKEIQNLKEETDLGNYKYFMIKEIHEQAEKLEKTFYEIFDSEKKQIMLPKTLINLYALDKITIIGCGTSYYAGLLAKYWIENLCPVDIEVETASEFRYRNPYMKKGRLAVFISQSGETADTLAALKYCKEYKQTIVSIVNVENSSIARESDVVLYTKAGPEIGVASTKAFSTQILTFAAIAIVIARAKETITKEKEENLTKALAQIPTLVKEVLNHDEKIKEIAENILSHAKNAIYLGRGMNYPIALEGALKLKEISYIHAEGFAAGEMKHGPIALLDEKIPVVMIAPSDNLFDKTASNLEEAISRGAKVILLSDKKGCEKFKDKVEAYIELPFVNGFIEPILYAIPVQLLAYYTALKKGCDVDKPRNLAKSVTVE